MDSQAKKRQRCMSFSSDEKLLIANVCAKYKHILENKKTDHTSSEVKNKTWEKIASEVNATAVNSTYRSIEVLKRFYENRKREVRKLAAEEKREIYATGGGQSIKIKKDACHDIILTMMNGKTVYGLENDLDGDAEPFPTLMDSCSSNPDVNFQPNEEFEVVYESNVTEDNEQETMTWKKYIPADLKKPVAPKLLNFDEGKIEASTSRVKNDDEGVNINTPQTKKKTQLPTSRRRPALEIKALTRSDLAEKYDRLMDKRLEIAEYQKKKLEEELATIQGERKLKFQLIEFQIEVEKEKLKQLGK